MRQPAAKPIATSRIRASAAAAEAVLVALASPRPPLAEFAPGSACLTLAGTIRVVRRRDDCLAVHVRDARGRWHSAADFASTSLLHPRHLLERAVARAVDAALDAAQGGVAADRGYVERRLREDLFPRAGEAHTERALRNMLVGRVGRNPLLRTTFLIFGRHATFGDMADVARAGSAVLARLCDETPNLAPLLASAVRRYARKGAGTIGPGYLGQLRQRCLDDAAATRIAPRDWRYLSHQPRASVAAIARSGGQAGDTDLDALLLRLFAATGVARLPAVFVALAAPGAALERALGELRRTPCDMRLADLARLVRLASLEWTRRARLGMPGRHVRDDLAYLVDWWIDASRAGPQVPPNATYASLVRRQQRWHQDMILAAPEHLLRWPNALPAHESGGTRVVPLTDSLMLAREGMEMRHCVASYARDCAAGTTRIFALEQVASGERATLELRRRAGHWFAGQLKGPCNAPASEPLSAAAQRLAARYNRADIAPRGPGGPRL